MLFISKGTGTLVILLVSKFDGDRQVVTFWSQHPLGQVKPGTCWRSSALLILLNPALSNQYMMKGVSVSGSSSASPWSPLVVEKFGLVQFRGQFLPPQGSVQGILLNLELNLQFRSSSGSNLVRTLYHGKKNSTHYMGQYIYLCLNVNL